MRNGVNRPKVVKTSTMGASRLELCYSSCVHVFFLEFPQQVFVAKQRVRLTFLKSSPFTSDCIGAEVLKGGLTCFDPSYESTYSAKLISVTLRAPEGVPCTREPSLPTVGIFK
eukprot:6205832-Pleurochrysis_carterae.AAC.5